MPTVTITNWGDLVSRLEESKGISSHVSFCHWASPEYSDTGQSMMHALLAGVAVYIAIANAQAAMEIDSKRNEIAQAYADIAEDRWNQYAAPGRYRDMEVTMINEIMSQPPVQPDYNRVRADYGGFVSESFGQVSQRFSRYQTRYALCPNSRGLDIAESLTRDDTLNYGYRHEERWAVTLDDTRWNRKLGLMNLGRNTLSQAASFAGAADKMLSGLGQQAAQGLSGAMSYLGYYANRNATVYPAYSQSFMNSSAPGGTIALNSNFGGSSLGGGPGGMYNVDTMF